MDKMIEITNNIFISEEEFVFKASRSAGPGGQNVNKVASAVLLRFDVKNSPSLREDVKERLTQMAGSKMNRDGVLVIQAERFRTQAKNRRDAQERLVALIKKASPTPRKRRRTRPTRADRQRRLEAKRHRSRLKRLRTKVRGLNGE